MRQSTVRAGAVWCCPSAAPRREERTRGRVQVRPLPADAELGQSIPCHEYFLQWGNGFWPAVLCILADSSCCNSFVLLTTRGFGLCSGKSLPNSRHGAGRARRWLREQQQQTRTHALKVSLRNCCSAFLLQQGQVQGPAHGSGQSQTQAQAGRRVA